MTGFWDTVLYPVIGEVLPWLLVLGVPLIIYSIADRRRSGWRDRRREW